MLRDLGDSGAGSAGSGQEWSTATRGIISDSKSGVSGAGKEATQRTHFVSVADNLSAYGVFKHRHLGEMAGAIGLASQELTFTPHLLPIPRGILSTIYVSLSRTMTAAGGRESCYPKFLSRTAGGCGYSQPPQLPEIQFRCTRTTAISGSAWRTMDGGW